MSSNEEEDRSPSVLFQQSSHSMNEPLKLTEDQLKKYETWKTQPGMAQIKLEYVEKLISERGEFSCPQVH